MSRGPYPVLLLLAMSLPGAAKAVGLGDIRIDSALNEPLSAQIDIVGATRDELMALTASVANQEVFRRYGADRPSFLASATFKVGLDARGNPVLNVRSAESFTDPVVNFLVDIRWGKGELIREYSLLLDPAVLSPAARLAANPAASNPATPVTAVQAIAAPAAAEPATMAAVNPAAAAPAPRQASQSAAALVSPHRVAARDTLRAIARRAGAVTESHAQRMMIAIFRANPAAFDGNINVLHAGALLTIPSPEDVSVIDAADAKREVRAQMTAWRLDGRPAAPRVAAMPAAVAPPPVAPAGVAASDSSSESAAATAALRDRVASLETALSDVHQQLAAENAKIQDLRQQSQAIAPAQAPAPAPVPVAAAPIQVERLQEQAHPAPTLAAVGPSSSIPLVGKSWLAPLAGGLALLLGGLAYVRRRVSQSGPPAARFPEARPAADRVQDDTAVVRAGESQQPTAAPPAPAVARTMQHPRATLVAPDEIVAREITPRASTDDTAERLGIDTEALEQSYIDSLGIDSVVLDTAATDMAATDMADIDTQIVDTAVPEFVDDDTATHDIAAHDTEAMQAIAPDPLDVETAVIKADPDTAVLETRNDNPTAIVGTLLDYNLLDLDATAQHVHMTSELHSEPAFTERRTNIVDVLKSAIDKDPQRRDLRMKLLETYYGTVSSNQRAFLDVVRKLAREREFLSAEDWQKVHMMGREIAPHDILFADPNDEDLANCA